MEINLKQLLAFREIVVILIRNSLLLSMKEKEEFMSVIPNLGLGDLMEMFGLLVGSKRKVDDILKTLALEYPQVVKDLDKFQIEMIKKIYKAKRKAVTLND